MRVLLLYAHPAQTHSQTNSLLFKTATEIKGVTAVDLYAAYPRHDVDVAREQRRLVEHDLIVFQFPLYWYSTPPLLKEWLDLVLEHGFAYGEAGVALHGKKLLCAVTAGSPEADYAPQGRHRFTLRDLLAPLEATASLCGLRFLEPFVMFGALAIDEAARSAHVSAFKRLLTDLRDDALDPQAIGGSGVLTASRLDDVTRSDLT